MLDSHVVLSRPRACVQTSFVVAVLLRTRWCQLEREVGRCAADMATPLCASQDRACMYVQSTLAVVTQPLLCVCVCMCLP